jgi:hypothetical protein
MAKPVDNWRAAPKMASVQLAAAFTALSVLQALRDEVLPLVQFAIPQATWPWVSAAFGIAFIVARLWHQALDARVAAEQSEAQQ